MLRIDYAREASEVEAVAWAALRLRPSAYAQGEWILQTMDLADL